MRNTRFRRLAIAPIVLAVFVLALQLVPVWAQSSSGSVRGTVKDSSNAVVPGADVTLTNMATNVAQQTLTNDVGIYVFPTVGPGQYRLVVDLPGMRKYEATLTVQVQQAVLIDVSLAVGEVSTDITVQDVTPLVVADNPTLGHTLERLRIEQLPINGRNLTSLLQTVPGLDVNGTRASGLMVGTSDYILDGAAMSDPLDGGATLVRPPGLDTIQEFNVSVNATSARFTRPTNIVMSTKSGSNQFHGTLFETNRNNAYGVARSRDNTTGAKPPYLNRNEYGGTAGGPVRIPGVYNGKDRTFWFFSFEQMKLRNPVFRTGRVPTTAMRQGDFSELKDSQGRLYTIYDPWTTNASTWQRQQAMYGGKANAFDPSRISPLAKYMFSVIPQPTFADRNPLVINNFEGTGRQFTDQWTTTIRVDHQFTEKDQFYARYIQGNQNAQTESGIPMLDEVANYTRRPNNNKSLATSWAHTFSPTVFNELLVSGTREHSYGVSGDSTVDYNSKLGLPNPFGVTGFPTVFNGIMLSGNYFQGYNTKAKWFNFFIVDDNMTKVMGRHELQFGAHIRYDQLTILPQQRQAGGYYSFSDSSYTGLFDPAKGTNNPQAVTRTGHPIANTFLGLNNYTLYMRKGKYYIRAHENAFYFQDNFRATNRLSLNLGLRWQITPFPGEKNHVMNSFDVDTKSIVLGQPLETLYKMNVTVPSVIAQQQLLGAKFTTYDQVGLPRKMVNDNWLDIGPRLGFAYQALDGAKSFVIRAGYALSYYPDPYFAWNDRNLGSAPFSAQFDNQIYSSSAFAPDGKPRYGMRSVPTLVAGLNSKSAIDLTNPTSLANSIMRGRVDGFFFADDYPTARVHNWNLTLEKEIIGDTLARVSYVGNWGAKQSQMLELNDPTPEYVHYMTTHDPLPQGEYADVALRPLDQTVYGEIGEYMKSGHSVYSGIQLELEKRFTHGFGYQFSYVLGNAFRNSVGGYASGGGGGWEAIIPAANQSMPGLVPTDVDQRNELLNYGRDFSVPQHSVRWNWTAELPFGKGKWLAGDLGGFWGNLADKVIGGWQVSGMGYINGSWFRVSDANDLWPTGNQIEFYGNKYPILDCTGGANACIPGYLWWNGYIPSNKINTPDGIMGVPANYKPAVAPLIPWGTTTAPANFPAGYDLADYWDTSTVFIPLSNGDVAETAYAPGLNPLRNKYLPGPFAWNLDVSIGKQFRIGEGKNLRFNLDAFNIFNHPTVAPTDTFATYLDNGILYMNGQTNTARQLQLTLRLGW